MNEHPNDPLHGVMLQTILERLVAHYGWEELVANRDPLLRQRMTLCTSSLTFLRRTPWARARVDALYLRTLQPGDASPDE